MGAWAGCQPALRRPRCRLPGSGACLWTTLGTALAQTGAYPHGRPCHKSCCVRTLAFRRSGAHPLGHRKCLPALDKKRFSTAQGLLYYYCYLSIEPLKNNQGPRYRTATAPVGGQGNVFPGCARKKNRRGRHAQAASAGLPLLAAVGKSEGVPAKLRCVDINLIAASA